MEPVSFSHGNGRAKVSLSAQRIGSDLIVCIFNGQGHIGAVAVADFCQAENRASTSVLTRLGHKDDAVACQAAHDLCKHFKMPVCVIAGIHLDRITDKEIAQIRQNCIKIVNKLIHSARGPESPKEN